MSAWFASCGDVVYPLPGSDAHAYIHRKAEPMLTTIGSYVVVRPLWPLCCLIRATTGTVGVSDPSHCSCVWGWPGRRGDGLTTHCSGRSERSEARPLSQSVAKCWTTLRPGEDMVMGSKAHCVRNIHQYTYYIHYAHKMCYKHYMHKRSQAASLCQVIEKVEW